MKKLLRQNYLTYFHSVCWILLLKIVRISPNRLKSAIYSQSCKKLEIHFGQNTQEFDIFLKMAKITKNIKKFMIFFLLNLKKIRVRSI